MSTNDFQIANRDEFIQLNKNFIYGIAYNVCKRRLDWENDDEMSIALIAFNKACDTFSECKGDFFSYAKVIIRNALIDYFRKNTQKPVLAFDDDESALDYIEHKASIDRFSIQNENIQRAEEIILFTKELSQYGLSFNILADSCPSHSDTRDALLNVAALCSNNNSIIAYIKRRKLLPIKEISLFTNCNKKTLEKWRRYLLALILILHSDEYSYLKSYLKIKAGD